MALVNCFMESCTCRKVPASEVLVFRNVSAPVGALDVLRMPQPGNTPTDVRTVQQLLNLVPAAEGGQKGPGKGLAEDGIAGPHTRSAIVLFQRKQFPRSRVDGVVQKSKHTIHRLNMLAYPDIDEALRDKARGCVRQAASHIRQARALVNAAQMQLMVPNPLVRNEKAERLLNYHFHLDKSRNRARDLGFIDRILLLMLTAAGHEPLGPSQKPAFGFIDKVPSGYRTDPSYAFTFGGGYRYLMGKSYADLAKALGADIDPDIGGPDVRVDRIYLTRKVLIAAPGILTYVIIHELAHFVGGIAGDIDYIDDKAYWHKDRAKYEALSSYEATTNADCYSEFCWEVVTGSRFRP